MAALASARDQVGYLGLAMLAVLVGLLAGMNPWIAIGVVLGIAFVLLVLTNMTLGLCVFVVVAFVDFLPGAVGLTKLTGFLLALAWLANVATREDRRIDLFGAQPAVSLLLLGFLAWAGLSLAWAESASAGFTSLLRYALVLLLFPIVYAAVQTPKHVLWVIGSFVAGATASAVIGVATPSEDPLLTGRLASTLLDPNELAAVLVAGMVLAGALAMTSRETPGIAFAATLATAICAAGIVLTLSRGGLIATGIALAVSPLVAGRWRGEVTTVAAAAAVCVVAFFAIFAPQAGKDRVTSLGSGTGRTDIWKVGWRMVEDKPVTGVGSGNFQTSSVHYLVEPGVINSNDFFVFRPKVAHNTYLHVLAELGVVGLALFASILLAFATCAIRAARVFDRLGYLRLEILSRALVVAVAGMLAADFFISDQFGKQLWLLLALGPAMLGVAHSCEREAVPAAGQ